ncbi:Methyl-accepting chemotaxis protein (MCP) signalling domain-containing protein [Noviherbaspirillum humi]|uniref:Methyl-accepting chemotaxis protein (MCP) signalling domain-containing protein n=1 Tax=Noviherbaspirillum humi TaxID=1688639 RepID=A0A239IQ07_9BURK|nr:hypothetical protein [Noviherbaspirillum humi]SNS95472.1 Methyl-accepting chemotaxis protein (MCP) signalling domain-containing protein [Noviherbaspirillum humi]
MGRILFAIHESRELVDQIADATQRQAEDIRDVGQAIGLMGRMTQEGAEMIREAEAAAMELHQQASLLADDVSIFNLPS